MKMSFWVYGVLRKESIINTQENEYFFSFILTQADDYYKCLGYVYFYKALSNKTNEIKIDELTLTMVCTKYPKKMIEYLEKKEKVEVAKYQ